MKQLSRRDVIKGGLVVPTTFLGGSAIMTMTEAVFAQESVTGNSRLRERLLLDFGWRFHFGHASDAAKDFGFSNGRSRDFQKTGNFLPVTALAFDDENWSTLDLPHDWVPGLPFTNDPALASKGFYPIGRSYPEHSVGWYRRIFELPEADKRKRISIEFDGVYRDALVVLNGFYIGQHRGGYDSFSFDVTDFVIPGEANVLTVRVEATESDGWFYEGAGIYRHTWVVKTAAVHVKQWGTFVRSTVQSGKANLQIRTELVNHADASQSVRVLSTVLDPAGEAVAKTTSSVVMVSRSDEHTLEQTVSVDGPMLWSLEQRHLYTLLTEVEASGVIVDRYETRFGIRSLRFDADHGFFLNDTSVKIKGTCNHQDHAGLGVALPDAAQTFRVLTLQEMGCNAYRSSHNPPTPELLDACDELGMLFLDETRMMSSNPEGLSQFEDLVRRDRNHPCVFMWSMGNEEHEATTEAGLRILSSMKEIATRHDGSRPVTVAPPPLGFDLGHGGLVVSDVMGYNYADPQIEAYHLANPKIPVMGTENVSGVATRGIYKIEAEKGFSSSYDPYTTTGRASAEGWWRFVNARSWMPGGFIWTGFDYRGEPSPYQWPNVSSQYGVLDTCGFPKDTYFYYQAWWTAKPVLHIFPHWNWPGLEGKEIAVWVYSNMDRVELFQDGKSLGVKDLPKDSHVAWTVTYQPGKLEARGFKGGRQVTIARRETVGKAVKLTLRPDRAQLFANGEDLAFFAIEVRDEAGSILPITDQEVAFKVTGAGKLIGVGNGDPTSHESDIGSSRRAFSGRCMAIVQAGRQTGEIRLEATSPGLKSASATVSAKAVSLRGQLASWNRKVPAGEGVTGLWRPVTAAQTATSDPLQLSVAGDTLYTLLQKGSALTGTLEAPASGFGPGGGAVGGAIEGNISDSSIVFHVGTTTYTGTVTRDRITLQKSSLRGGIPPTPPAHAGASQPVIGPPPDGSDPSLAGFHFDAVPPPIVLRKAAR